MSESEIVHEETIAEGAAPEDEAVTEESEAVEGEDGEAEAAEKPVKDAKPDRSIEDLQKEIESYKTVSMKERRQRQQIESRYAQLNDTVARIQQRIQEREEAAKRGDEPQIPDVENDPIGAIKFMQDKIARYEQQQAQEAQQRAQYDQQAQAIGRLKTHLDQADAEFAQEHPDFPEAAEYYAQIQMQGFMASGMSQDEAYRHLQAHVIDMSNRALQRGISPQQIAYDMAKRMGFRSQAELNKPSPLANVKAGQAAAKTMSGGGKGAKGPISFEDLSKIKDDAEFSKRLKQLEAQALGQ